MRFGGLLAVLAGLALFGALASAREAPRNTRAVVAASSTTWMQVASDCTKPGPGPSGNWIQEGNGCWDQHQNSSHWTVSDGSASDTEPGYSINMSWSMPGSIAGTGGPVSMSVSTTNGVSERVCVLQAYTSFTTAAGGDICAQTSASMASASAGGSLLPNDAADGTLGYVWVSLGDGGNLYYTYKASAAAPPPSPRKCSDAGSATEACVVAVVPDCQFHKGGSPPDAWLPLEAGTLLKQGDEITCDPDGRATLRFFDSSTATLGGMTQLKIASLFTEGGVIKTEVLLKMGEVAAQVNKSAATKSDFKIQSPTGGAGVRGTTFKMFYDPGSKTSLVSTSSGSVLVTPANSKLRAVVVGTGREVEVTRTSVSNVAPIGKAGARGGVNIQKARDLVVAVVAHHDATCKIVRPRGQSFAIKPAPGGWAVTLKLPGKAGGTSKWRVLGKHVKPANAVAKKLAKRC